MRTRGKPLSVMGLAGSGSDGTAWTDEMMFDVWVDGRFADKWVDRVIKLR